MSERPLNIVVGILVKDGKCLLIRRVKDPYKNHWSIPGGKLELGEDIRTAAERELLEETGLVTKFTGLRGIVAEVLRDHKTDAVLAHFLIWICGVKYLSGNPEEKSEGEVKWFGGADLEKQKNTIIPSDYLIVKRYGFADSAVDNFHIVHMRSGRDGYKIERTDL